MIDAKIKHCPTTLAFYINMGNSDRIQNSFNIQTSKTELFEKIVKPRVDVLDVFLCFKYAIIIKLLLIVTEVELLRLCVQRNSNIVKRQGNCSLEITRGLEIFSKA